MNALPVPRAAVSRARRPSLVILATAAVVALALSGCGRSDFPSQPGDYNLLNNEVRFDGQNYAFRWLAADSSAHQARADKIPLVQDDRTFLRVGGDGPVLHLAEGQSVQVEARDRQGSFATPWYPFFWGPIGGRSTIALPPDTGGNTRSPSYRYPPTDSFGRNETLGGSLPSPASSPPDYARVPNARDTVAGQAGGTGGGTAATNRASGPVSGQSGGGGSGAAASDRALAPVGGQGGGSGGGSAASEKGGFSAGPRAYSEPRDSSNGAVGGKAPSDTAAPRVGAGGAASSGALKPSQTGSGARSAPATSSSGSKGVSGARRR